LIGASGAGLMMAMEDSLIYFPSVYPDGFWNPPGLDFEDARFAAADGTKLHGWYVPTANPRAVILFAHGNAGNLSHRFEILEMLNRLRVSVLIFDYRGYGRSEGSPSRRVYCRMPARRGAGSPSGPA
jgi:pimeloyl-ACP methyl ester carboxylesterase